MTEADMTHEPDVLEGAPFPDAPLGEDDGVLDEEPEPEDEEEDDDYEEDDESV